MHLEDLKNNAVIRGLLPDSLVTAEAHRGANRRQAVIVDNGDN